MSHANGNATGSILTYSLRRDGWVKLVSAGGVGTIGTNPLVFGPSKALRINANAAGGGELRVQVTSG